MLDGFKLTNYGKRVVVSFAMIAILLGGGIFALFQTVFKADVTNAFTISFRISDQVKRVGIPDANIVISSNDPNSTLEPVTNKSDGAGSSSITVPNSSFTNILVTKDGFWDMEGTIVNVGNTTTINAGISMKPGFGKEDIQITSLKKTATGTKTWFGLSVNPWDDFSTYPNNTEVSTSYDLDKKQEITRDANNFQFSGKGQLPEELTNAAAVYSPEADKYYIFGGKKTDGTLSDAVYEYDYSRPNDAARVATLPYANADSSAIYLPTKKQIYYFATNHPQGTQNEFYSFEPQTNYTLTPVGKFPAGNNVKAFLTKDRIFLAQKENVTTSISSSTLTDLGAGEQFLSGKPRAITLTDFTPYYSSTQNKVYLLGGSFQVPGSPMRPTSPTVQDTIYQFNPDDANSVPEVMTEKLAYPIKDAIMHRVDNTYYIFGGLTTDLAPKTDKMIVIQDNETGITFNGSKDTTLASQLTTISASTQGMSLGKYIPQRTIVFSSNTAKDATAKYVQTLAPTFTLKAGQSYGVETPRDTTIVFKGRAKTDAFTFTTRDIAEGNWINEQPNKFANPYATDISVGDIVINYQEKDYTLAEASDQGKNIIAPKAWLSGYPTQALLDLTNQDQVIKPGEFISLFTKKNGVKVSIDISQTAAAPNPDNLEIPSYMVEQDIDWAGKVDQNTLDEQNYAVWSSTNARIIKAANEMPNPNENLAPWPKDPNNPTDDVGETQEINLIKNGKDLRYFSDSNETPITNIAPSTKWTSMVMESIQAGAVSSMATVLSSAGDIETGRCFMSANLEFTTCPAYSADKVDGKYKTKSWDAADVLVYNNLFETVYQTMERHYGTPIKDRNVQSLHMNTFLVTNPDKDKYVIGKHIASINSIILSSEFIQKIKTNLPDDWEKVMNATIIHETAHAFHGSRNLALKSWEEGYADYLTYLVMKEHPSTVYRSKFEKDLIFSIENNKPYLCQGSSIFYNFPYDFNDILWNKQNALKGNYGRAFAAWDAVLSVYPNYFVDFNNELRNNWWNVMGKYSYTTAEVLINKNVQDQRIGPDLFSAWYRKQCGLAQLDHIFKQKGWKVGSRIGFDDYAFAPVFGEAVYPINVQNNEISISKFTFPASSFKHAFKIAETFSNPPKDPVVSTPGVKTYTYDPKACNPDCDPAVVQTEPGYQNEMHKYTYLNKITIKEKGDQKATVLKSNTYTAIPRYDAGIYGVVAELRTGQKVVEITPLKPVKLPPQKFNVENGYFQTTDPAYGKNAGTYKVSYQPKCSKPLNVHYISKSEGKRFLAIRTGDSTTDEIVVKENKSWLGKLASIFHLDKKTTNVAQAEGEVCYLDNLEIVDIKTESQPDGTVRLTFKTTRPAHIFLDWGKTEDYDRLAEDEPNEAMTEHSVIFNGLEKDQIYHFNITALDGEGQIDETDGGNEIKSAESGDQTFEVKEIKNIVVTNINNTSATISWETSADSLGKIEYGGSTNYGSASSESAKGKTHTVNLTSLSYNTTYHFRVKAYEEGKEDNPYYSNDQTFSTQTFRISNLRVDKSSSNVPVPVKITWETNAPATCSISGSSSNPDANGTTHEYTMSVAPNVYTLFTVTCTKTGATQTASASGDATVSLAIDHQSSSPGVNGTTLSWTQSLKIPGKVKYNTWQQPSIYYYADYPAVTNPSVTLTDVKPGTVYDWLIVPDPNYIEVSGSFNGGNFRTNCPILSNFTYTPIASGNLVDIIMAWNANIKTKGKVVHSVAYGGVGTVLFNENQTQATIGDFIPGEYYYYNIYTEPYTYIKPYSSPSITVSGCSLFGSFTAPNISSGAPQAKIEAVQPTSTSLTPVDTASEPTSATSSTTTSSILETAINKIKALWGATKVKIINIFY